VPSRTAVYTTVFPNALPFLERFAKSILAQTDQDFDLWVGLDRLETEDLEESELAGRVDSWIRPVAGDTFATVRQRAWERIAKEYDQVILVDPDDILHPARVKQAVSYLDRCDVYACALELIDEHGEQLGVTLEIDNPSDPHQFLSEMNVFGLSNTAYRCSTLSSCLTLPRDIRIIDWHLVSRALADGAKLFFDPTPLMAYRLYSASTTRILAPFEAKDLLNAADLMIVWSVASQTSKPSEV
jgi:hypothetical protein